jgi:peptide deformylase
MQHELDHLEGKLYIDYLGSLDELISTEHDEDEEGRPAAAHTAVG